MSGNVSTVEKNFIFNFLMKNNVHVEIKCDEESTEGKITEMNTKEIKIVAQSVPEKLKSYNVSINVFFYFQNNYHTFTSNIVKIQNNIMIIKNPDNMAKNLERKHERIIINGSINVDFELPGKIIKLDYPETRAYYFPSEPPINADFTDVKIENILAKFKTKMNNYVSTNKIQMMRNYKPKTFYEEIVVEYGKSLLIANTRSDLPEKQPFSGIDILVRSDWNDFDIITNGTSPLMVNKSISDHLTNLSKNNITSFAIIPAIYRNYIIAIITLVNDHLSNSRIDERILIYTKQFTNIMTYTLMKGGYFKAEIGSKDKFTFPMYDLTPAGLAIYHSDETFENKMDLGQNIEMHFPLKDKSITLRAKLVRKFQKNSKYFYGFVFIDVGRLDVEILNKYLYKK